jgi:hypothetical protein
MRRFLLAAALSATVNAMATNVNFDSDDAGRAPAGWTCGATGRGTPTWSVEADPGAPGKGQVLKQSGKAAFPWCVKNDTALTDGWVEVKFKAIAGREDQAGGVVWRWKDGDNYYVARANALENNVSLYHTTGGSRRTIEYKDAPVAKAAWHTLRVDFKGNQIRVSLDGKTCIERTDDNITGPGKVGVWTKADSVTLFDDFAYGEAAR